MAYVQKPGQGSLFKNDKKTEDSHPDYSGSINIDGKDFWLNGWIKTSTKGKYFSLSVKPKKPKPDDYQPEQSHAPADLDDEIPFAFLLPLAAFAMSIFHAGTSII